MKTTELYYHIQPDFNPIAKGLLVLIIVTVAYMLISNLVLKLINKTKH